MEAAAAWAAGKPLVIYKDDVRTAFKGMDNSMVSGLIRGKKAGSIEAIPGEINKVLRKRSALRDNGIQPVMPEEVAKNVKLGRRIWIFLSKRKTADSNGAVLIREIAAMCS